MHWHTPISALSMVGPVYEKRLLKLEIKTVGELLWHIPARFEDYSHVVPMHELQNGMTVTCIGTVLRVKNIFTRSKKQMQKITLSDGIKLLEVSWFNQPYITTTIKEGMKLAVSGRVDRFGKELTLNSPEYEIVRPGRELIHTGRLVPIYPQTYGVSSKWLRSRIALLLEAQFLEKDHLPDAILDTYHFIPLRQTLQNIHFPKNLSEVELAKKRLSYEELLFLQLTGKLKRHEWQKHRVVQKVHIREDWISEFTKGLPFTLTEAQEKVLKDMYHDLEKETPMNRLLEGDVGSGKTVVAALLMYLLYKNKGRSILMAPTEILAEQHFVTLKRFLEPLGLTIELITGSHKSKLPAISHQLSDKKKKNLVKDQKEPDILVGTHALIEKKVTLDNVRLIVIDEQHRFGVRQRALLRGKGDSPHVLTMTATPIPRTVALAFHGDLDLSIIDTLPHGRLPIKTWVVPKAKRENAYLWLEKEIRKSAPHNQAFIICPFIEPSETMTTVKAATEEYEKLQKKIFPKLKLGLLHGKMKASEKQEILVKFRAREFDILVSTPVVEVGIDIPGATVMVIEAADRFGLAQLHQIRGRVGRNDLQSYCFLFSENGNPAAIKRLKLLETMTSGRELAEADLEIRGAGDVFGFSQHGEDALKIASYTNRELVEIAGQDADKLLNQDIQLTRYPLLKQRVLWGTIAEVTPD